MSNEMKLMEKLVRAKIALEGALKQHKDSCPVEADPEYYGPCKCGADAHNASIRKALDELEK